MPTLLDVLHALGNSGREVSKLASVISSKLSPIIAEETGNRSSFGGWGSLVHYVPKFSVDGPALLLNLFGELSLMVVHQGGVRDHDERHGISSCLEDGSGA